jgi:hypothetical protein
MAGRGCSGRTQRTRAGRRPRIAKDVQDHSTDGWMKEVVRLRTASGRVRFLLRVRRDRCPYCATGVRTTSVWVTRQGKGEVVAWCGHCFNATCEPVALDDEHQTRFAALCAVAAGEKPPRPYQAVRPAVEDLERRGLL